VDRPATLLDSRSNQVQSVAFNPDGSLLAAGTEEGNLVIWHTETGAEQAFLPGDLAYSITFSPDGTTLASSSNDIIYLWDIESGQKQATLTDSNFPNGMGAVYSIAFSPDGTLLASGSADATIRLWNVQEQQVQHTLQGHTDAVKSIAFSPDGTLIASGGADGSVLMHEVGTDAPPVTLPGGHTESVESVSFHPDGELFVSASTDGSGNGSVRLWTVQTHEERETRNGNSIALFSPGGTVIASGDSERSAILLQRADTGEVWSLLQGHRGDIQALAFSPDKGRVLASGSSGDSEVWLWRTDSDPENKEDRLLTMLHGHTSTIWSLAFSPDGSLLASASFDGSIRLWGK
jgi:WD40 repeat protein